MRDANASRLLVTAALPYANGPAHLGHMAGAYLPADIFCRYQRLMGRDVLFICGSDEHGVAIMIRARSEGVSPRELVDRFHPMLREAFQRFGMSFDHYGRTSSQTHCETSQDFFRHIARQGAFTLRTEPQLYDATAQLFLADRFVRGTCPTCGYTDAYGDQCEQCGRTLSPKELLQPRSAVTGKPPEVRHSTHWFLSLASQQPWLEAFLAARDWKPNVEGQARSWLNEGLVDRSMTRDLPWGVPVPADVAEAAGVDASGKVLYVWFDAPIGYISSTREWATAQGDPDRWRDYWQGTDTKLVHFIGKDNIVFHCIIFPAMLHMHGGYVLPTTVPANEFLNLEGRKLSTSRDWAVWLHEALEEFPADYLRYALLRVLPETKDSDFTWKDMQSHVNNELADTLGNFVNRTVTFAQRFLGGRVPDVTRSDAPSEMARAREHATDAIGGAIESYRFREACNELMGLARIANRFFNDEQPWATRKTDEPRCRTTIGVALQTCASLSILCEPLLPTTARAIREMLQLTGVRSSERAEGPQGLGWEDAKSDLLIAGRPLGEPTILFKKIEDDAIGAQIAKLHARATSGRP